MTRRWRSRNASEHASLPSTIILDANGRTRWRAPVGVGATADDVVRALP
jgi:hypothetical protein